jgi:hypothetical protein
MVTVFLLSTNTTSRARGKGRGHLKQEASARLFQFLFGGLRYSLYYYYIEYSRVGCPPVIHVWPPLTSFTVSLKKLL